MNCYLSPCRLRLGAFAILFIALVATASHVNGQLVTPTTSASIANFNTHVLESMTGWAGSSTTTGVTSWDMRGTGSRGSTGNGINQTGGTSGGWYGDNNISFLGSGTASAANGTLRLRNNTGSTIAGFRVVYTARMWRSNTSASPAVSVSWSASSSDVVPGSGSLANALSSLGFTDATASISTGTQLAQTVSSASIANGNYVFLRWIHAGGTNSDNLGWDEVNFIPCPIAQVTGINFTSVTATGMTVNWSTATGNGRRRAVFMKSGPGTITNPSDGTLYTASTTFGSGTQLGTSGYYCVYDGTGTSVAVTNLTASTTYYVQVFEYNCDATPTAITATYLTTFAGANQSTLSLCSTPTAYNVTGTGSYCAGGTGLAVGLDNSTTGVNYQLYNGAATVGSPVAGNTGSPISFGLQTIAGTYTVLATTAVGGCTAGMTGSAVITINSLPTVGFSPSAPAICSGGAGVAITASGASTYTWVPTSTLTASTGTTVTATPTTTTTYTITGTSAEGCTGINTVTVSVNPLPTPTISGDVTIPSGGSAVLTFSGTEGDIVYFWNGASTISTTITASGTSTVSVSPAGTTVYSITSATSALGCSQSITGETATVTISSLPSASISGTVSICPGGNTNLLFSGTAGATVFFSTDGATPQNVVLSGTSGIGTYTLNVTPSAATTYTLDSIVSDSYHGSLSGSATVSIYTVPTAYTVTGGGSYCSGGSGLAVGLSTSQTDVTYQLYNGGVTVGTPVAGTGSSISFGTFTATGTYSVLATDDNTACTNAMTSIAIIAINALPAITSITTDGPVCQGASLQLSATISGTSAPYSYSWSGSSGFTSSVSSSSLTNTVSTSAMPGTPSTPTYTVVVTDANGCTSIGTNTVSTSVILFSAGTISGTTSVSVGLTTTFTSNGTSGGTWSSSDETKATIGSASGIVTGMANGTARITYTVTNSCGTVTATTNVTVTALTPSTITSNSWTGTTSSTSTASDPSGFPTVPSATGVVFSQWQRGSGLGGNTGGAYNSNSFASTSLSGAQSGNDYLYFTVTNNASIEVKLTQLFLQTQVSSSGPTNTQLLYKIGSGAEQTFSTVQATTTSGSASTETYSGAACLPPGTTTEFRLYGWGGSSTGTFRVNAGTSVTGSYVSGVSAIGASTSNSSPVCSGNSITLSGSPTNGAPPYTYDWNGPSSFTSTVQSPTTSAVTAGGTYTFAVTDQLGCSATATTVSTVNANPVAIAGASAICVAATTTYTNATGGGTWISSNTSVAGIGSTSGLLTPSSAGVTTISYQLVSTGCYAVKTVTVAEMPATITGATSVCVGGTSTFANSVSGGTWSSSNTAIGTIGSSSGTVSALSAGTTAISYSIVPGCETGVVLTVNSTPTAAPSNSGPICVGGTAMLMANPGGSTTTYSWSGPSLSATTSANPTATSTVTSVYSLTVSNGTSDAGCTPATVYTTMVTVRPAPTAAPANNGYICVGGTVSLTANPANGANTYNWSGASVSSATTENPTATPTATAVYSLTVSDGTGDAGCAPATVYTTSVIVNSTPTAAPTNSGPICNGGTVNLAANGSASASTYTWSGSSLSATTAANPTATPTTTSIYSLTVSDGSGQPGCSPTTVYTTSVTVNSTPTAAPSNSGPICVGGTVMLTANPGGSTTTYAWSGPSLSSTTVANPTATPTVTSVYSLTVSNGTSDAGCTPATVYTTMVTVRSAPTAAPANNGYICVGGTVSLTANPANGANTYNWSGASISSATTENPTATPISTTVYSLTVSDGTGDAGCAPATVYITSVTVNNTPTAAPTNSGPICNGGTVNLAANGSAGATNYTWSGASLSATTAANPTATPTTTSVYSLTVSDGSGQPGCSPTTVYTTSVTVNSTPTAAPSNSGPICVGGTVTLTANPGGSTTTYSWSGPSLSATTSANPTATPTVTSVYSLTVSNGTGDAGCSPATVYTTMVTVRPTPTAAPSNNGYICVGGTVSLTANPANGANTYNWTGASISSAGAENPTATPTSTSVYSLTVSDGTGDAGCAPATVYITSVTVNNTPTAAPTNSGPICNGGTVNLAANGSAGATNYTWSGASLSSTTATNPTATPTTTSIYSLTVSDGSGQPGCSPTTVYTTSVTVNSTPTAAPSNSGPICVGGTVTLTANPGGSTTTYSWSGPSLFATTSANPTATPTVTSVYSLTVSNGTSDAGCTPATVYTTTVTVRPTPTAAPANNGYICVGGTVSLTANPANGANTYNWTGASVSSATTENPTATPTATSVYSLTVSDGTGDAGCAPATVYTTSVAVNIAPTAAPTNSGPICNGGTVNLSANGSAGATSYTWSGSSLSSTTATNPTATPSTTSVYSLTVSDGSGQPGCSPTTVYTTSVTVNSTPTAAPSNSGPICVGGTVTLTANPGGSTTTYSWSGPSLSATTAANPTATPTVTSVYSLTVSNGTSDAGCTPATVYTTMATVRPTPTAAPANNGYICVGGMVSLTANPANGANTYNWSGASISSATTENPTATPTVTTVYSLTVSDGTGDAGCAPATVYTTSVTVNSTPTAAPTNSGPICNGGTVNLSANGSAGATSYTWSGSSLSSTTATNPTATPSTTSVYSLTVSDGSGQPGCSPTTVYTTSVTVNSTPTAFPSNSGPICVGGTVMLMANPGGSTTTYSWSGPSLSATTSANPTATPTVTSVYSLTVSNGTSDAGCAPATVYTTMVTVRPTPTAAPSNNGYICVGGTVSLTANPANGANTYNWSGASVSSATTENPTATPTVTTVYSLTVSDGTGDAGCAPATVYTTSVTVNNTPTAAPTNSGPICNGGTVNLAANGSAGATSYIWSGVSLSSTTAANPTATPTTTSVYSLTVSDGSGQPGCSPTTVYTTSVTVNSTPTAAPSNSGPICVGGTVILTANPGGSTTTYSWSGPSLSASTVANPTATPTVTSVYSLTVSNGTSDAGCTPATVYTTTVTVRPAPTAAPANNGYICVGGTVSLTANPANGANTYNWSGASISSAGAENPTATPTATSVYSLTVSDGTGDAGCAPATVYTTSVTVNSTPTAAPTNSGPICNGGTVNLSANGSAGATSYTWSGPSLSSTTATNPTATPSTTSVYSLTVSDGSGQPGCSPTAVYTTSVTVNSTPTAAPSNSGPICVGGTVTLSANPGGSTTTYSWSGPSLSATTAANPTATPTVTSVYSLTVSNGTGDAGCAPATVYTTMVTVRPTPTATPSNNGYICVGGTVSLAANPANGANTYNWTGASVSSATTENPTATPTATTVYSLTVSDGTGDAGCAPATVYTTSVTVNSTPTAAPTNSGPTCAGGTINLISNSAGGAATYFWSGPALSSSTVANPVAAPTVTSVYSLTVSDGSGHPGCAPSTVYTTSVTVNSVAGIVPTVVSSGGSTICEGESSSLSTSGADDYIWVPSTGLSANTGATVVATPSATTTYTVTGAKDGCTNIAVVTVSVNPVPQAITGTSEVCKSTFVVLSSTTPMGVWSSSNPSIATVTSTTGQVSGVGGGTATITYTKDGCFTSREVTVHAPAAITSTGYPSMCIGQTYALGHPEAGGAWSSSSNLIASVNSSGLVTGVNYGTATITYTNIHGCNVTKQVTVGMPAPIDGMQWACLNSTIDLDHSVAGGTWSSSNPARATVDATTGVVYGVSLGNFYITYTLFPGCYRAMEMAVQTFPLDISGSLSICEGASTTLANETASGTWSSSDTTVALIALNAGTAIGLSSGTTNITYKFQGCYHSEVLTVNALPTDIVGANELCEGSSAMYSSMPTGGTWVSGNTSRASIGLSSGSAFGVGSGSVLITYTAPLSGCRKTKSILVNSRPGILSGTATVCAGNNTTITSMSDGGTWSSSNLSVATVGTALAWSTTVSGLAAGTTDIVVSSPMGCTRSVTVTVNAAPSSIGGGSSLCTGGTLQLTNAATGGSWTTSISSIATVNSSGLVTGMAPGTAIITYATSLACFVTKQITVNSLPGAIMGPNRVCVGSAVTLTHADAGGTWTSSTPTRATVDATSGQVTGISTGVVYITYNAGSGCLRTTTLTVNPIPAAISGASALCEGTTSAFTNATPNGTWTSSNLSVASVPSSPGNVSGVNAGVATITYMVTTTGCFTTKDVTVNTRPASISGASQVCVGSVSTYVSAPSGGTWASSMPTRASVDPVSGQVEGISTGSATLTYSFSTGCYRTQTLTVNPIPLPIGGSSAVCRGATTALNAFTSGGTWSSGNTTVASIAATGVVTGVSSGMADITYKLIATGCQVTRQVTVNELPSAISGVDQICIGSDQSFTSLPSGGTWTSSATAKATIGSASGTATGIAQGVAVLTYTAPTTGCVTIRQISVNPIPAAITSTESTVCVGNSILLTSLTAGQTWVSTSAAISLTPTSATTASVVGTSSGSALISYVNGSGCFRMITINVSPAVAPITGDMVVCPTRTIQLSTTATGGTWASALTSKATVNAAGLVTGVNAGNVNISYVVSPGCNAIANITVNAIPASIYGATYVCVGDSVDLNHAISGGVWNTSSALTSVNASNGMVTGISTGTSTITYSINSGCWVTAAINVRPTPAPITGILTVPVGSTSALANTTSGGIWSSSATGIATISSSGLMAGVSPGNAIITYRVTSTQCYVTGNATVTGAAGKVADQEDGGYIKVYPNPTNGRLNVEASCNGVFSLYTLDGKLLQQSSTEKPSTIVSLPGNLSAGVYMCRFDGADGSSRVIRIVYQP